MKKILLLGILSSLATSAYALDIPASLDNKEASDNTQFKLEGLFNFQGGYASKKNTVNPDQLVSDSNTDESINGSRKKVKFYTESYFSASIRQQIEELAYGAKIVLVPTSKIKASPSLNGSHIFLESEFGKVELGSPHDAASKLRITGGDVAAGGVWGTYGDIDDKALKYKGLSPEFADSEDYFQDVLFRSKLGQISDKAEPARKVSYYTPKMQGFQAGISYTPDTGNTGGGAITASQSGIDEIEIEGTSNTYIFNKNVKDALAAGLSYEHNISDGVDLKVAASGEYGKSAGKLRVIENKGKDSEKLLNSYKLSDLATYNLGLTLNYGNFSYGASYGTLGKSLTTKEFHKTGRNTKFLNGAVAYGQGPIKTSVSYFKSNQFANTLNSVTLGSEYKLAPGLLPYAELSYFEAKGKPSFYPEAPKRKTRGTVAVLGAKLKF
jgi:hypothetical protein